MRRELDRIQPDRVYWHSRKEAAGCYGSIGMMHKGCWKCAAVVATTASGQLRSILAKL
jgi:hypothetical protein